MTEACAPEFKSTSTAFHVIFKNMNYNLQGNTGQDTGQDTGRDTGQDDRMNALLNYCEIARTRKEMQEFIGISSREYFNKSLLVPLLEFGQLKMTIPDKPSSRNQRYIKA